jgi:hypothetical protein
VKNIEKAHAISDAKIQFVSLVDKAANKKRFLITKAEQTGGMAAFQSFGRILKADNESHFVTGIVYEPMVEDTDGDYMTAEEIEKAAHWFMKHGGDVDIQHCFQKAEDVDVVESFVAKCDMEMEGQKVSKGTWIMTMEVTDAAVWDSITKGEITGFSMGGIGNFSQEDVDLGQVEKSAGAKGLFRRLAKSLGMDVIEKGEVKDDYRQRVKSDNFWTAHYALEAALRKEVYVPEVGYRYVYTEDEDKIRDALTDFNEIIMNLLSSDDLSGELEKAAKEAGKIEKAGKSLSSKNLAALQTIATNLSDFLAGFAETDAENSGESANSNSMEKSERKNFNKEDAEMTQEATKALVEDAVKKAVAPIADQFEEIAKAEGETGKIGEKLKDEKKEKKEEEEIEKMVEDAVKKAMVPIQEQLETIRKSRSLPNNLNDEPVNGGLEKSEQHYLHGIL